ncbi:MAG TPA: DUF4097 family beta strand repeat-containing protein [Longimicrobium sp.]|nr:DUF4097 family beta strand repeat-containing protein [Longimicrobium sp.]
MHRGIVGATIVLAAAAPCALEAQGGERFVLEGTRAAVYNLAGAVRVEAGTGSDVVVEVTRGGGDGRDLRVRVDDGVLAVTYPGDQIVYPAAGRGSSSQTTVRDDGTFGGDRGRGGRRVRIAGSGSGREAWADLRVLVPAGRTVSVHQAVGRVELTNVSGDLRVDGLAASIRSQGTRGSLTLDTGSGSIEVRDAEGEVELDTGSGGVRMTDVDARHLTVDTGSGGVTGRGIRADMLKVDVGSGGVRLDQVAARDILVDTGSGSVGLSLTADAERVRIDTGSGGVTLSVPSNFGAALEIDTGSGGIAVDVPVTARRASRSSLRGTVGDGRGTVIIDTGSGGVRIRGS